MKTETATVGVSIPHWIMDVVDRFRAATGKSRSHYAARGILKQVVFEMRSDQFLEHAGNCFGETIDRSDRVEMTITVPAGYPEIIREHLDRCGYDQNSLFDLAILRFIVGKDSPSEFWKSVLDMDSSEFRTVIN
jgi:hypothetical protein